MGDRLPGGISTITTNPLLTAGISSIRKPVIFGVGDVKVLVENERVIRGAGSSDALVSVAYGSSTAYQLANVIMIGNSHNSADYLKTTDYAINGSDEVDWTGATTEPDTGSEYYVTYYKTVSNFVATDYTSEVAITSAHGGTVFSATKQFATATTGSSGDTLDWANSETIPVPTEWTIRFTSGSNTNITRSVSGYAASEFTVSPNFPNAVSVGDIFEVEHSSPTINMLTVGSLLALRNGAQSVIVGQLDNTAFTDTLAPSGSEYGTALTAHLTAFRATVDLPYYVVPMLPNNSTTFATNSAAQTNAINLVWNHCKLMSTPENKGERTCVAGFLPATTIANFKSYGSTYFSERMIIVAPSDLEFNEATRQTLNGSIGAAAMAGKVCSKAQVSQSILNEDLVGVTVATNFYNSIEQRELTAKGISFIINEAGVVKVIAGKTTDVTSADTEDIAVVAIADYVKKITREQLTATFTGKPINSRLKGAIGGKLSSIFESLIYEEVISNYDPASITVAVDVSEPRKINVTASISPQYTLWFTSINMAFYV